MKVILLEDMDKIGKEGDVVDVAPGYARNFLLVKKKALISTPGNMKKFEEYDKKLKEIYFKQLAPEEETRILQQKIDTGEIMPPGIMGPPAAQAPGGAQAATRPAPQMGPPASLAPSAQEIADSKRIPQHIPKDKSQLTKGQNYYTEKNDKIQVWEWDGSKFVFKAEVPRGL